MYSMLFYVTKYRRDTLALLFPGAEIKFRTTSFSRNLIMIVNITILLKRLQAIPCIPSLRRNPVLPPLLPRTIFVSYLWDAERTSPTKSGAPSLPSQQPKNPSETYSESWSVKTALHNLLVSSRSVRRAEYLLSPQPLCGPCSAAHRHTITPRGSSTTLRLPCFRPPSAEGADYQRKSCVQENADELRLRPAHIQGRNNWAYTEVDRRARWKRVVFSDKKKFNLDASTALPTTGMTSAMMNSTFRSANTVAAASWDMVLCPTTVFQACASFKEE